MKAYRFSYLIWLLPAYLLFLTLHQGWVLYSLSDTYNNGSSLIAELKEYNTKQIGSQTSGHILIEFTTDDGQTVEQYLSLPFSIVRQTSQLNAVPIRYQPGSFIEVVLIPSYDTQTDFVWTNLGMAGLGLLITLAIAFKTQQYANKKRRQGEQNFVIERVA